MLYYACILYEKESDTLGICKNKTVSFTNCFIGLTVLTICEPLSVIPYYLRSLRLYVIFRAQDYYFKNLKKPNNWFKYIKERVLIKLTLILTGILAGITTVLFLIYSFGDKSDLKVFMYTPSYNVQICYINTDNNSDS
jgi:hypothetical protein